MAATVVPFVPGGAGATIKVARAGEKVDTARRVAVPNTGRRAGTVKRSHVDPKKPGPPKTANKPVKKSDAGKVTARGGKRGGTVGSKGEVKKYNKGKGGNGRVDNDGHNDGLPHTHAPDRKGEGKKGHAWWRPWDW